jgi:hypothetical protein
MEAVAKMLYCPETRVAVFSVLLRSSLPNSVGDTLGRMAAWAPF